MVRSHVGAVALALMVAGCGDAPTGPFGPDGPIALDITLSAPEGGPGAPITATVVVSNRGRDPILRVEGCVSGSISFSVVGPHGALVLADPCAPVPLALCAGRQVPMPHLATLEEGFSFDGTHYDLARDPNAPCAAYQAPAGDYEIVARFFYRPMHGEGRAVERGARFHWTGP